MPEPRRNITSSTLIADAYLNHLFEHPYVSTPPQRRRGSPAAHFKLEDVRPRGGGSCASRLTLTPATCAAAALAAVAAKRAPT